MQIADYETILWSYKINYNYGNRKKKVLWKAIEFFFTHYIYFIFLNLFEDAMWSILFKQEWFTVGTQSVLFIALNHPELNQFTWWIWQWCLYQALFFLLTNINQEQCPPGLKRSGKCVLDFRNTFYSKWNAEGTHSFLLFLGTLCNCQLFTDWREK